MRRSTWTWKRASSLRSREDMVQGSWPSAPASPPAFCSSRAPSASAFVTFNQSSSEVSGVESETGAAGNRWRRLARSTFLAILSSEGRHPYTLALCHVCQVSQACQICHVSSMSSMSCISSMSSKSSMSATHIRAFKTCGHSRCQQSQRFGGWAKLQARACGMRHAPCAVRLNYAYAITRSVL